MQTTKHFRIIKQLFALALSSVLVACNDNNNDRGSMNSTVPASASTAAVYIDVDVTSGSKGTAIELRAIAKFYDQNDDIFPTPPETSFDWLVSDGRTFSGTTISVPFEEDGLYSIELTTTAPNGTSGSDDTVVTIFDSESLGPSELSLPQRYSDVNNDSVVNALDYLILAQHVGGISEVTEKESRLRGDLDIDGELSERDLRLVGEAILNESDLPDAVISDSVIRPFSKATLISPILLDPDNTVSITIDGFNVEVVSRNILGYAELVVPKDIIGDRIVDVILDSNGFEAETISIKIGASVEAPTDPISLLREYRDLLEELQPYVISNYEEIYGEGQIAEIYEKTKISQINSFSDIIDSLGDEQAEIVSNFMVANGLSESLETLRKLRDEIVGSSSLTGISGTRSAKNTWAVTEKLSSSTDVCDIVDSVCALRRFNEDYEDAADHVSDICIVGAFIATITSGVGGTIIGTACFAINAADVVNSTLNDLAKDIDFDLQFEVTEKDQSKVFNLFPFIEIKDGTGICRAAGNQAASTIAKELVADKVADIADTVIKKKIRLKKIKIFLERLGSDGIQAFEDFIEDAVDAALPTDRLAEEVVDAFRPICDSFGLRDGKLIGTTTDPTKLLTVDLTKGSLSSVGDGSADFTCGQFSINGGPIGDVTVTATKSLCRLTAVKSENVTCGGSEVTATFGDNGNLLDDIFAIEFGGKSFSSNSPVRSTSGTVTLPSGTEQTVVMRGLAAPDGIGTYFITFSGATVISGQTTGTDLAQGVTKTITIFVN